MDRAHRHTLKHDKFVEQVGHTVEYAAEHKREFVRWSIAAIVVVAVVLGVYFYTKWQSNVRQDELRTALRTQDAQISPTPSDYFVTFPSEAEKSKAVEKAFTDLAAKYSGKPEGLIARYYLGINSADKGNIQEAEKHLKEVAESGNDEYSSQAKLSLAHLYEGTGRIADAEKMMRSVMNDPTILVSKEQATIALARILAKSRPDEARKLLEPLRTERGPVSRAALTAIGEIPAAAK